MIRNLARATVHRDCNGQADAGELTAGLAPNCNLNAVPDECPLG